MFQKGTMRPLPEDAEKLARLERMAAVWANDETATATQIAAARKYAKVGREISCIRSFREELLRFVNPARLDHKTLLKLVALDRCERLAKAAQKRANERVGLFELEEPDHWLF